MAADSIFRKNPQGRPGEYPATQELIDGLEALADRGLLYYEVKHNKAGDPVVYRMEFTLFKGTSNEQVVRLMADRINAICFFIEVEGREVLEHLLKSPKVKHVLGL